MVPSLEVSQTLADIKINSLAVDSKKNLWIGGFQNDFYITRSAYEKDPDKFNNELKLRNLYKKSLCF